MKESEEEYIPNEVPIHEQIRNVVLSLFAIIGGGIGLMNNNVAVKICRRCDTVYHFNGVEAYIMYIALLLFSACFMSEVVDHYDKRNNEHLYHRFSNFTLWPGIAFFVTAFIVKSANA